jgi:4-amino-4-deoxychorismate mutase
VRPDGEPMSTPEFVTETHETLDRFRAEIDRLDKEIVRVLASRLTLCREVAEFKKQYGIPMMQPERVARVLDNACALGERSGLDPAFMRNLYREIIDYACQLEDEIIGRPRPSSAE